jgi:hypothetical protein
MTAAEMDVEFQILFEDLATAGTKGLNAFERSTCLTYAQEKLAKQLAEARDYDALASLTITYVDTVSAPGTYPNSITFPHVSAIKNIGRWVVGPTNKELYVKEVPTEVIQSMLTAPYKYPPKNVGYMVYADDMVDDVFLPLNYSFVSYHRRVIEYPTPIITDDITPDTINGISIVTEPIIHKDFHRTIVEMAVQFAIVTYIGPQEQEAPSQGQGS